MGAVWSNLVAVAGTLAGGLLVSVVQARVARATRRETRDDQRRTHALAAVTALLAAVADHRRASWDKGELRLSGAGDEQAVVEARKAGRVTRSAITAPLATVCILIPALADVADAAVQASYVMRNAVDLATLEQLRAASVAAEKRLRQAASGVFATEDCRGGV